MYCMIESGCQGLLRSTNLVSLRLALHLSLIHANRAGQPRIDFQLSHASGHRGAVPTTILLPRQSTGAKERMQVIAGSPLPDAGLPRINGAIQPFDPSSGFGPRLPNTATSQDCDRLLHVLQYRVAGRRFTAGAGHTYDVARRGILRIHACVLVYELFRLADKRCCVRLAKRRQIWIDIIAS
jgi:hypothetical protein